MRHRGPAAGDWQGECAVCGPTAPLGVTAAGGRWTLRELFTSAWQDRDVDIVCRRCGRTWPADLSGRALDVGDWLDSVRRSEGAPKPSGDDQA